MKIIYFSRHYTTHDHRFLSAIAKKGHEIGYLQLERRNNPSEDRPLPPEVRILKWRAGSDTTQFANSVKILSGVKKIIRDFKPDLIQAGPIQRSAFLVALTGFHPLVAMSWGYDLLVDAKKGPWWKWATSFTLQRSDALVADCETIRARATNYGIENERIVTFPWGADIHQFTPADIKWRVPVRDRLGWDREKFVMLSTRSWSKIYGVEDLVHAFVKTARIHPEIRLFMLGNGPLAPAIQEILMKGGVRDLVCLPGQISQERLPDYYRAADLYISTSHSDGTSISMLEALASGTPVLLSDIPGNKEWISESGEVGWLFRDGDVDSLSDGISHAIANRHRLESMGDSSRKLAELRANWELNAPHLFEAYRIALS